MHKRQSLSAPLAPAAFQTALRRAQRLHQAGDFIAAREIYDDILGSHPNQSDALKLRGTLCLQIGAFEVAVRDLSAALHAKSADATLFSNLSAALFRLGRLEEAETAAESALAIDPNSASAHNNLGNALRRQFRIDAGRRAFERALAIDPDNAQAKNNLNQLDKAIENGDTDDRALTLRNASDLYRKGQHDEAERVAHNALMLWPDDPDFHNLLGAVYIKGRRYQQAREHYEAALRVRPRNSIDLQELSHALCKLGLFEAARDTAERATEADPMNAHAFYRYAEVLTDVNDPPAAMVALNRAIELKPDLTAALNLRGLVLARLGRSAEAAVAFLEAIQYQPQDPLILTNLASTFKDQGRLLEAYDYYVMAIDGPNGPAVHSNALLCLQYIDGLSPEAVYDAHLEWAQRHVVDLLPADERPLSVDRTANRKLRIGYLSPDFRSHSVSYFFEPMLDWHDRDRYEVVLYADVTVPDTTTERMKAKADIFRMVTNTSDEDLADIIRKDNIDILFDLAGHTGNNRQLTFARKPAPVQISWLGYPDTTGNPAIDYRFSDAITEPEGAADRLSTERILRLPDGFHAYRPSPDAPQVEPCRQDLSAPITFGSFNAIQKINERVIGVWAEILKQVPESQLLLKHRSMADPVTRARYLGLFEQAGIDPRRVVIHKNIREINSHLAAYNMIDIALDPFPYNGTTTTCEALWMGVPVIAKLGCRHVSRVTGSLLHNVGLADLVAEDDEGYVARAVALANEGERLMGLRQDLRRMMAASPLCDEKRLVRHVEDALTRAWTEFCQSAEPATAEPVKP